MSMKFVILNYSKSGFLCIYNIIKFQIRLGSVVNYPKCGFPCTYKY